MRWIAALFVFASIGWSALYLNGIILVGRFIHWRFSALDWAQIAVVGLGPLALTLMIVIMARRRKRISN